jgi:hypothetical protein
VRVNLEEPKPSGPSRKARGALREGLGGLGSSSLHGTGPQKARFSKFHPYQASALRPPRPLSHLYRQAPSCPPGGPNSLVHASSGLTLGDLSFICYPFVFLADDTKNIKRPRTVLRVGLRG